MRRLIAAMVLGAFLGTTGCASFQKADPVIVQNQTDRAILLSVDVYDVVMTGLGTLYKTGNLTNDQRDTAVKWANVYRDAALRIIEREPGYDIAQDVALMQSALAALKALMGRL